MSQTNVTARVLVLSEDSGKDSVATITTLLRQMLRELAPTADLERLAFDPLPDSKATSVLYGNVWKSAKGTATAGVVDLVQRIARYLILDDLVVHHVDGDTVWSERDTSENARRYAEIIVNRVRETLRKAARKPQPKLSAAQVDERLQRLIVLMPHWCIESWLFQNVEEAARRCPAKDVGCRALLDEWEADRSLLDEVRQPKEKLPFRDKHNLALVRAGLPTMEMERTGQSYAAAVEKLKNATPLLEVLESISA